MSAATSTSTIPTPSWLKNRFALWVTRMGLRDTWNIDLRFVTKIRAGRREIAGLTDWEPNYQEGTVKISKIAYDAMDERAIDRLIVHELSHLVKARESNRLQDFVGAEGSVYKAYDQEDERVCDMLASIITKAYSRKRSV